MALLSKDQLANARVGDSFRNALGETVYLQPNGSWEMYAPRGASAPTQPYTPPPATGAVQNNLVFNGTNWQNTATQQAPASSAPKGQYGSARAQSTYADYYDQYIKQGYDHATAHRVARAATDDMVKQFPELYGNGANATTAHAQPPAAPTNAMTQPTGYKVLSAPSEADLIAALKADYASRGIKLNDYGARKYLNADPGSAKAMWEQNQANIRQANMVTSLSGAGSNFTTGGDFGNKVMPEQTPSVTVNPGQLIQQPNTVKPGTLPPPDMPGDANYSKPDEIRSIPIPNPTPALDALYGGLEAVRSPIAPVLDAAIQKFPVLAPLLANAARTGTTFGPGVAPGAGMDATDLDINAALGIAEAQNAQPDAAGAIPNQPITGTFDGFSTSPSGDGNINVTNRVGMTPIDLTNSQDPQDTKLGMTKVMPGAAAGAANLPDPSLVSDPGTVVPGGPVPGLGGAVEGAGGVPTWPTPTNPTGDTPAPPTGTNLPTTVGATDGSDGSMDANTPSAPPTGTNTVTTDYTEWWAKPELWATLGAGAVGAAGSIIAGNAMADAQKSAAQLQKDASDAALAEMKRQFEQQRTDLEPWRSTGAAALDDLKQFNPTNPYTNYADFGMDQFKADPGYGFRLSEGMKALENSAAARGQLLSGNTLKGITDYGQQSASQEYQNAFNRYHTEKTNSFNRNQAQNTFGLNHLQSMAGLGQTATQQMGQAGQNYAGNYGNALMSGANAMAQGTTGAADARASGWMGAGNALTNALSGYYNNMQSQNLLNALMNRRA